MEQTPSRQRQQELFLQGGAAGRYITGGRRSRSPLAGAPSRTAGSLRLDPPITIATPL